MISYSVREELDTLSDKQVYKMLGYRERNPWIRGKYNVLFPFNYILLNVPIPGPKCPVQSAYPLRGALTTVFSTLSHLNQFIRDWDQEEISDTELVEYLFERVTRTEAPSYIEMPSVIAQAERIVAEAREPVLTR